MEDKNASTGTKEDLNKEVSSQITELKLHAQSLVTLCEKLTKIATGGDAAITVLKEAKEVADGMKEAKESLDKVRKALKTRAQAILKDC